MNIRKVFLLAILFVASFVFAAPKQVNIKSEAMNIEVKNIVVLPSNYDATQEEYPVIYLLHGFGGNQDMWISMRPDLERIATAIKVIFVLPDGGKSWYWDSPADPKLKYETYVAKELTSYIDKNYRTKKDRKYRAITGLSMGGHGALWLSLKHPDVFGASGSTSGGVDITQFPQNWEMAKILGAYESNKDVWMSHTIMGNLDALKAANLAIIIDCGTEDFFYKVNEALHYKMLEKKIQHDYITRPGAHDADYWKNSIDYQIVFFSKFFAK